MTVIRAILIKTTTADICCYKTNHTAEKALNCAIQTVLSKLHN